METIINFATNELYQPDIKLKLLDEKNTLILCHKMILSTSSDVFMNILTSTDFNEKGEDSVIEIKCNPLNLFPDVMKFIYLGTIDIDENTIMGILEIALFYKVETLSNSIIEYLESLDFKNIFNLVEKCHEHHLTEAIKILISVMASNYEMIALHDFIKYLDIEEFENVLSKAIQKGTFKGDKNEEIKMFLKEKSNAFI